MTMTSSSSNEKTFSARLMVCLGQEDMTDLHLLFKDGVRVPAFRAAVLCGMLYGPFQEGASTEIRLDYRGDVLTALAPAPTFWTCLSCARRRRRCWRCFWSR